MPKTVHQNHWSNLKWLSLSIVIVVADQLAKWYAVKTWDLYQTLPVTPFLTFTLTHNTGAAYGFLDQAGGWQRFLFVMIAFVVIIALLIWLLRLSPQQKWTASALACILGGAIGNVWDRFMYGYVIDFINIHIQNWHLFGVFNIADIAISLGAVLMMGLLLLKKEL